MRLFDTHPIEPSSLPALRWRRHGLLGGLATLAAGLMVTRTASPVKADDNDTLEIGNTGNPATGPQSAASRTELNRSNPAKLDDAVRVTNDRGIAVNGISTMNDGTGVSGEANSGSAAYGVRGLSNTGYGVVGVGPTAVWGQGRKDDGGAIGVRGDGGAIGVRGDAANLNGTGVFGQANTGEGAVGVRGESVSGVGVRGRGSRIGGSFGGDNGPGVYCFSHSLNGQGVLGLASNGPDAHGVEGQSDSGVGVFGRGATFGGYFKGAVHVEGTLTKGSGGFKIDHPLDPANQYLVHSFVESPDMLNVYNGNVTTDAHGEALVVLPSYFEALNRDARYQLTVLGQFAQAIVATEAEHNRFTVRTDKPHVRVSWLVTGVRRDPYAEQHRLLPEEPKGSAERGKYLHPELYAQPATARVSYQPEHEINATGHQTA